MDQYSSFILILKLEILVLYFIVVLRLFQDSAPLWAKLYKHDSVFRLRIPTPYSNSALHPFPPCPEMTENTRLRHLENCVIFNNDDVSWYTKCPHSSKISRKDKLCPAKKALFIAVFRIFVDIRSISLSKEYTSS